MRVKTQYSERPDETAYEPVANGTYVRFRENIRQLEDTENETWEADEYSVFVHADEAAARARVERKPQVFLAKAKLNAVTPSQPLTINDLADAVIELSEIIAELTEE